MPKKSKKKVRLKRGHYYLFIDKQRTELHLMHVLSRDKQDLFYEGLCFDILDPVRGGSRYTGDNCPDSTLYWESQRGFKRIPITESKYDFLIDFFASWSRLER